MAVNGIKRSVYSNKTVKDFIKTVSSSNVPIQLIQPGYATAKSYDAGQQSDVIIMHMDITKAFDTFPHNRLKLELQWYGITGTMFQWISSFLTMLIKEWLSITLSPI